jgi:hypothetical protein
MDILPWCLHWTSWWEKSLYWFLCNMLFIRIVRTPENDFCRNLQRARITVCHYFESHHRRTLSLARSLTTLFSRFLQSHHSEELHHRQNHRPLFILLGGWHEEASEVLVLRSVRKVCKRVCTKFARRELRLSLFFERRPQGHDVEVNCRRLVASQSKQRVSRWLLHRL